MIRYIRARNTEVLPYLEPHIVEDPDFTKSDFLAWVGKLLVADFQHTFVLVAFNEQDELVGFMIAYAPEAMVFTFVYQAWIAVGASPEIARTGLSKLKAWTDLLGRSRILAETRRNPEAFFRKWGFKEVSKTLELNLFESEDQDGRWEQNRIDPIGTTETGGREAQQVPDRESRSGSGTVQRPDGGESVTAVRHGSEGIKPVQPEHADGGSDSSIEAESVGEISSESGPDNNG